MEEKSRFAQILIFWDAVLLGTLIFISLSVKPGLRCLWLHSAMLAACSLLRPAADPSYIFTDPDADHHYLQEFFAV